MGHCRLFSNTTHWVIVDSSQIIYTTTPSFRSSQISILPLSIYTNFQSHPSDSIPILISISSFLLIPPMSESSITVWTSSKDPFNCHRLQCRSGTLSMLNSLVCLFPLASLPSTLEFVIGKHNWALKLFFFCCTLQVSDLGNVIGLLLKSV